MSVQCATQSLTDYSVQHLAIHQQEPVMFPVHTRKPKRMKVANSVGGGRLQINYVVPFSQRDTFHRRANLLSTPSAGHLMHERHCGAKKEKYEENIETAAHQPVTEQAADDSGAKRGAGLGLCNHDCVGHTCACMQLSAHKPSGPAFRLSFCQKTVSRYCFSKR